MKLRRKIMLAVSSLTLMAAVLLTGCGAPEAEETAVAEKGFLVLSVNPEIRIEYNEEGQVTALSGQNQEGQQIVDGYQDYVGKDARTVVQELIVKINEAGYFVDDIDGNKRNVVLQIEPGSMVPNGQFLEEMSVGAQEAIQGLALSSETVTISDDDYDQSYAKDNNPSPYITLAKAQEIALAQAHVAASEAVFEDKEFDHDDGTPVFELEFTAGGNKYEYDVHAVTGKIIKAEHEVISTPQTSQGGQVTVPSGSTNYGNTNYGSTNYGNTNYDDNGTTNYGNSSYSKPATTPSTPSQPSGTTNYDNNSNYGNSSYGNSTNYDDGGSNYSDDDDDDDDDDDRDDD